MTVTAGGVNVTMLPNEKFKTAHFALLIRRPLRAGEAAANALLARVLKRGQAAYPTRRAVILRAEELYGAAFDVGILKKGEEQIIQLYAETADEPAAFDGAAALALGAAFAPYTAGGGFDASIVESEKARVRKAYECRKNDARAYARERCVELMCDGEPFGVYGDGVPDAAFDALDGAALYRHYERVIRESAMEIVTLGGTDGFLGRLEKLPARAPVANAPAAYVKGKRAFKTEAEAGGGASGKLCVGFRAGVEPVGDLYYPLLVANEIFGGGAESLLFRELREGAGLCYYASCFVYRFKSIVMAECGVDGADAARAAAMALAAAERLKRGAFSDADVAAAKTALKRRMAAAMDEPASVLDFTLTQRLLNDTDGAAAALAGIDGVTKAACVRALENLWPDTAFILKGGETA